MCGIFGYKGTRDNASEIVVEGLKRLDYRGYDSWGVGVATGSELSVQKQVGKISEVHDGMHFPSAHTAIAHTRWATTGAVTQANAHPHMSADGSFILAQNGIVENFSELKKSLREKGYEFKSETDTEVIVRLIEEVSKTESPFLEAIRQAFLQLEGRNTIIILTKEGEIYAARNGSPLVAGLDSHTGDIFLSSDTLSFAAQADQMVVIENNQLVKVGTDQKLELFDAKTGASCSYKWEPINISTGTIDKEGFDHFMAKEIHETPSVIKQIVHQDRTKMTQLAEAVKNAHQVYVVGCGTAGFAAYQTAFYLRVFGKVNAISLIGADVLSYYPLFQKGDLIIAPSQSGETADVIEVLEYAKKIGMQIASLVNMPGSMMTRMSDFPFMCNAGPEICVMSTKVFSSQITWGYLLAKTVQGKYEEGRENLTRLSDEIEKYLTDGEKLQQVQDLAALIASREHIFLLGKYQNFAVMSEGMVKIVEASYKHAHAIQAGDLKHYAITLMEKGIPVIVAVSEDEVKNDVMTAINEVRLRGAEVIAIASKKEDNFDHFLHVADTGETSALFNVIPLQLLAYYLAVALGNNVDKPRNIAKSVTVK